MCNRAVIVQHVDGRGGGSGGASSTSRVAILHHQPVDGGGRVGAEDAAEPRRIIYEDPELGFCICAHSYTGAKQGEPHDHGPTWAIYGQAAGETEMTDWEIVEPASDGAPAKVKKVRSYRMEPGDAHVYAPGDVHAPYRDAPTRLIRIEGTNTDNVKRTPIEAI